MTCDIGPLHMRRLKYAYAQIALSIVTVEKSNF